MLFNAAVTNQTQPESSQSLMGSMAGGRLPAVPLTPSQATASRPTMELGVVGESSEVTDRFREGPFDIYQDSSRSVPSPQLLQDNQGCLFRMTSYPMDQISHRSTGSSYTTHALWSTSVLRNQHD